MKNCKCEICEEKKAVIKFSDEPMMSMTHGYGSQMICRQCYINKIVEELKIINSNLKKQRELLKLDTQFNKKKKEGAK